MEAKKFIALQAECVCHGWGKGALEPPRAPFPPARILGESLLSGEVTGAERNTDVPYALDSLRDL